MTIALEGIVALVTGANGGIGREVVKAMKAAGATVIASDLADTDESGADHYFRHDVSKPEDWQQIAAFVKTEFGHLDALVNNAAHSIRRPIEQSLDRLHDYQRTVQLNYIGAVAMTLKLLPRFLDQGHGHVVNISSLSTQVPIPLFSAYLASKSALESFTRSLQAEMGHQGISTTVVYFPMVRTPMSSRTAIYKYMPMMHVKKAAGWIVEACEKRPARIARPMGKLGSVLLAALPGPATKLPQPLFRGMDKLLASQLKKKG